MYFYTAAVGEVRWKEFLSKKEGRIGSNTMEAFALLVLVNNYKAWLYEEKKEIKPTFGPSMILLQATVSRQLLTKS
jgi:hypothetical protein